MKIHCVLEKYTGMKNSAKLTFRCCKVVKYILDELVAMKLLHNSIPYRYLCKSPKKKIELWKTKGAISRWARLSHSD